MKRSSLFVCCGITLLYLSDRLDSRTVSPIVYLTTAIPNIANPAGYYDGDVDGQSGYYGGNTGGKSGYYGGIGGQSSGYYGGQSRNYEGGGDGSTGHYGGRSPTATASTYGSYGHRTIPESAVRGAIQPIREERSHALYESPNTYEYMKNPPRKSGKVSNVPETERLPPGDDVEFIDDGGGGGGGDNRRPAKDRRRDGYEGGERFQDVDVRPLGHQQNHNNNSKRVNRNKPKEKNSRKLPARKDDYTNDDDGVRGRDAEQVGSSTTGDMREGATAKKPRRDEYAEVGRKNKNYATSEDGPVKHKIHKKNEYSKRQQFFDEEHVDHGKKKPKNKVNHNNGRKKNGHGLSKQSKKKKRQQQHQKQQQLPTQKPVKRTTKIEKNDNTSRVVPQGYGQVVAVR